MYPDRCMHHRVFDAEMPFFRPHFVVHFDTPLRSVKAWFNYIFTFPQWSPVFWSLGIIQNTIFVAVSRCEGGWEMMRWSCLGVVDVLLVLLIGTLLSPLLLYRVDITTTCCVRWFSLPHAIGCSVRISNRQKKRNCPAKIKNYSDMLTP